MRVAEFGICLKSHFIYKCSTSFFKKSFISGLNEVIWTGKFSTYFTLLIKLLVLSFNVFLYVPYFLWVRSRVWLFDFWGRGRIMLQSDAVYFQLQPIKMPMIPVSLRLDLWVQMVSTCSSPYRILHQTLPNGFSSLWWLLPQNNILLRFGHWRVPNLIILIVLTINSCVSSITCS